VAGIVFAGPLPIRLGYISAELDPPFTKDNPYIWADNGVYDPQIPYPYATRDLDDQDTPIGALARWPVWLLPGNSYEVWVGLPADKNSAIVTYKLVRDDGTPVDSMTFTEIAQCQSNGEREELVGTYSAASIGSGGWHLTRAKLGRMPIVLLSTEHPGLSECQYGMWRYGGSSECCYFVVPLGSNSATQGGD
jgi:hypothetical protein